MFCNPYLNCLGCLFGIWKPCKRSAIGPVSGYSLWIYNTYLHSVLRRSSCRQPSLIKGAGGQMEVVLRVKQAANPDFGFLQPPHKLHPYYQWLLTQVGVEIPVNQRYTMLSSLANCRTSCWRALGRQMARPAHRLSCKTWPSAQHHQPHFTDLRDIAGCLGR